MQTAGISAGEWGSPTDNFSTEYRYDYNGNILSLQRKDATAQIMHRINYAYNAKNNRLQGIIATGINSSTYSYDAIGNLANDSGESVGVTWNAMNKVKTVVTPNSTLHFAYSPTGQRQIKKTGDKTEYYLHDATGNIMCVYELSGNYLTVKERTIYGSKRIGVSRQRIQLSAFTGFGQAVLLPGSDLVNVLHPQPVIGPDGRHYLEGSNRLQVIGVNRAIAQTSTISYAYKKGTVELKGLSPSIAARPTFLDGTKTAGLRDYELTDHLSNVMAVISDRKISVDTNSDHITDYYASQVVSFTDYYPFGFPMAERSGNLVGYRFGFNGQEADNEVYGVKKSYTAEFWQYDTRLGRRWNVDVKKITFMSPYSTFANNPIVYTDVLGDTVRGANQVSASRTVSTMQNSFPGDAAADLRNLFSLSSDGVSVSSINEQDFVNAISNLSTDVQQLAYGYYEAINSTDIHTVEMLFQNENLTSKGQSLTNSNTGTCIDNKYGGGINFSYSNGDSYTIIVMNSSAKISDYVQNGKYITRSSSAGELLSHEMLGHGLGGALKSSSARHKDAIQMTNLYLRIQGYTNVYRNGSQHGPIGSPILTKSTATSIPSFIQIPLSIKMNIILKKPTVTMPTVTMPIDNTRVATPYLK